MVHVLATRDVPTLFHMLTERGVSQRRISRLVGIAQSEVSSIVNGRRVLSYDLLVRVAEGLQIPRGAMGLAYAGDVESSMEGVPEDVKRRAFLAAASAAILGRPVLGEVLELPDATAQATPNPSRVGMADVRAMSDLTERMRNLARQYGGQGQVISAIAHRSTRLMPAASDEYVKRALASQLSELHTLAGWTCFDSGMPADTIRAHFARGMELASGVDDTYRSVNALYHSGMTIQNDAPNDSLKLLQMAQINLAKDDPRHERTRTLNAWLDVDSAHALAMMGHDRRARELLTSAQDGWDPADQFDRADMDHVVAQLHMELGELEQAERLAASSVNTWAEGQRRDGAQARVTLAALHVMAGESDGPTLASAAIDEVEELQSSRALAKLKPLHDALAGRGHDLAHRIATMQPDRSV